ELSSNAPEVSWRGVGFCPMPRSTIQMCDGWSGSRYPLPFERYTAFVITRTSLTYVGDEAFAGANPVEVNARDLPSGDHSGVATPPGTSVMASGSPPSAATTFSCWARTKAMRFPSGDQRGDRSFGPLVSF